MTLRVLYTLAAAVSALLSVAAVFMVWGSLRVPFVGTAERNGWEGDGAVVLMLGLLGLAFAVYTWVERRPSAFRLTALFTTFVGAVMFATALVNLLDTERAVGEVQSKLGVDLRRLIGLDLERLVKTEEGVYVAMAAGALLAVASALAFAVARLQPAAVALMGEEGSCRRCGGELPAGAKFCPQCGKAAG